MIDAAAAVEFAAKAVVARHDVDGLYDLDDGAELTRAQRLVLDPTLGPDKDRPIGPDREGAMIWLLQEGRTISASDAVKLAGARTEVDVSAYFDGVPRQTNPELQFMGGACGPTAL